MTTHELARRLLAGPDQPLWFLQTESNPEEAERDCYVFSRVHLVPDHPWNPRFLYREDHGQPATFLIDDNFDRAARRVLEAAAARVKYEQDERNRKPDPAHVKLMRDYEKAQEKVRQLREACGAAGLIFQPEVVDADLTVG